MSPAPPATIEELLARARALEGRTLDAVARELGIRAGGDPRRNKGRPGELVERALGATGGSAREVDFPRLGVELKTVPIDERGVPMESTHVCALSLDDADEQEWETSWVRTKLARVLFVPLLVSKGDAWPARRIGAPVLWTPTPEQERVLRGDFDDVMGIIGVGRIDELTAHLGRFMQVRPKARDGSPVGRARGADHEPIAAVPRGFYLRARFVGAILRDPSALP